MENFNMEKSTTIVKSAYIRQFKPEQSKLLDKISKQQKLKSVSKILLFTLERFLDNERKIRMLKMNNSRKELQISHLSEELNFLRSQNDDLMNGIND